LSSGIPAAARRSASSMIETILLTAALGLNRAWYADIPMTVGEG
jgi:hypothetical protein